MNLFRVDNLIATGIILIAACYAYSPISYMGFASVDDTWMLLGNPYVKGNLFDIEYLKGVFSRINDIQYSPINTIYYNLIYKINGFDPYYYHFFNFLIHLLNAYLVYKLVKLVYVTFEMDESDMLSFIITFFWCIHPLNVETVVWVSGSKILLCSLLTLLSLYYFFKAIQGNNNLLYLSISLLSFLASCFVKEQGLMTSFIMALAFICFSYQKKRSIWQKSNSILIVMLIGCILFSILFAIFSLVVNEVYNSVPPISRYPFYQRVILIFYCISFYVINFLVPVNLHYHYEYPVTPDQPMPFSFYFFPLFFILFCYYLLKVMLQSRQLYFYIFSFGLFVIEISIELQIIPMTRPAIMADRYMYIPSIGLLIIVCYLLKTLVQEFRTEKVKSFFIFLFCSYGVFFISYSNQLTENWFRLNFIK